MLWQLFAATAVVVGVLLAYPIGQGAVPVGCNTCNFAVGQWGQWGQWSGCQTNTFGQQVMTRRRQCSTTYCPEGVAEEESSCVQSAPSPSPSVAQWGQWGPWSACSATCGGGYQTRSRTCGCGVCQCQGPSTQQEACNTQACLGCNTCPRPAPAPAPVCNTCYNPVPAPIPVPAPQPAPPLPSPAPSPVCSNCNPVPAPSPCSTCGPPQPFYNPYSNGRKKRELLVSQMRPNATANH